MAIVEGDPTGKNDSAQQTAKRDLPLGVAMVNGLPLDEIAKLPTSTLLAAIGGPEYDNELEHDRNTEWK